MYFLVVTVLLITIKYTFTCTYERGRLILKLKIDSAASTGSSGNYMKHFCFPWPPVVAAHDRKRLARARIAVEVIGSIKTILIPRIQLCPSESYHSPQTVQKTISDQNRLCYDNQ